jgi:hypothetical protein
MDKGVFKAQLQACVTMEDFLKVCSDNYDFKNAKLGTISKSMLIAHIDKVIAVSGAKPKK